MSLASLAAYASSDESEEEAPPEPPPAAHSPSAPAGHLIEDEDDYLPSHGAVTASLPRAEASSSGASGGILQADDVVDDVPLADKLHAVKPRKSERVKIAIPSLAQFKDDDDGEPAAKKMKPSAKGSGLFSLLPPPKKQTTKELGRALLPQSVSRPAPPRRAAPAPAASAAPAPAPDPDSDEEPGGGSGDFFSLSEEPAAASVAAPAAGPLTWHERAAQQLADGRREMAPPAASFSGPPQVAADAPGPEPMDVGGASEADQRRAQLDAEADQRRAQLDAEADQRQAQLDAEALQRLRGRRGRREDADICLIDVNQDDILPDRDAWMTKQLTEEPVVRRPQRSADDPTAQQRRKHQITYLAHQAKEREVELKNEWAQNRATKNAYRTKYGF